MGEHFQFGGGANASNMTVVVLAATLVAAIACIALPRRYALASVLIVTFLTPFGQQIMAGGFHFFVMRIIIFASLPRLIRAKLSKSGLFAQPLTSFDKTFFLWEFFHIFAFILLYRQGGAVVAQLAAALDTYGGYILFRYLIQDRDDIFNAAKSLAMVAAVTCVCMSYEHLTAVNVFSYLKGSTILPWIRDGKVRAQGIFANSITAGVFGATLFPFFFCLWKCAKVRLWGAVGLIGSTGIVLTSVASTAVTAYLAAILGLCLWPIRKRMQMLRWGLVFLVLGFAMAMNAPVWFLIAKIDFVGGHGWDRAALVDQFVRHFSSWWLVGTNDNASWGADTWDACNQFVAEGMGGGIICLILFLVLLSRGFGMLGRARKGAEGDRNEEWFFWALGATLFSHVIAFFGIDYFDNIRVLWLAFLAMIPAATVGLQSTASMQSMRKVVTAGERWFLDPLVHSGPGVEAPLSGR